MNPMMAMFGQMMKGGMNPQNMVKQMMGNSQISSNPIMKNTLEMAQSGNMKGVEELARNLCKEKGLQVDDFVSQIRQNMGI